MAAHRGRGPEHGDRGNQVNAFWRKPALRRDGETEKGPHRSATPSESKMNITAQRAMVQYDSVRSGLERITPEEARRLRDTAHFPRQRNISNSNVERLAHEMRTGRFTPGTQVYIGVLPDGKEWVLNGNHTLEAVHASGIPQLLTITRKSVADEDDAGRVYAVFDIQKVRSWGDSLRATGAAEDLPNADKFLSAVGVIKNRFAQGNFAHMASRLDRIGALVEYREPAEFWNMITAGGCRHATRLMSRAAVLAVALETIRYQPSFAIEFWGRIASDNGLVSTMPEKALLSWLRNNKSSGGVKNQGDHARAAAAAWNAAFRGEERQYVKPNSMTSFFLLGTPWANGLGG
jgi:hypothetical protein